MNGSRWPIRLRGLLGILLLVLRRMSEEGAHSPGHRGAQRFAGMDPVQGGGEGQSDDFFRDYAGAFHLGKGTEMRLASQESDSLGFTHYRYQQYVNGVAVENAVYLVHGKGNAAVSAGGRLLADFESTPVQPALSEQQGPS